MINGGAIIPREATPYWRGRSRYVTQFLVGLGCPILYTVHGNGVCEIGASTRMSEDFIVLMLSTDCNREGAEQVTPVLHRSGYKEVHLAHSPGPITRALVKQGAHFLKQERSGIWQGCQTCTRTGGAYAAYSRRCLRCHCQQRK